MRAFPARNIITKPEAAWPFPALLPSRSVSRDRNAFVLVIAIVQSTIHSPISSLPPSATNRRNLLSGNPSWMLLTLTYELSSEFLKKKIYIYEKNSFEKKSSWKKYTRVYVSRRKSFTIRFWKIEKETTIEESTNYPFSSNSWKNIKLEEIFFSRRNKRNNIRVHRVLLFSLEKKEIFSSGWNKNTSFTILDFEKKEKEEEQSKRGAISRRRKLRSRVDDDTISISRNGERHNVNGHKFDRRGACARVSIGQSLLFRVT